MNLTRAILCILLPPVAVLHLGCGPTLVVSILTLLGWLPGALAALILCSQQKGDEAANMYSLPRLPQSQWDELLRKVPPAGPFEPAATEMQQDHLWRMGCVETSKLKEIRKVQASWLIDSGMRHSAKRGIFLGLGLMFVVLLMAAFAAVIWYYDLVKLPDFSAPAATAPAATKSPRSSPPASAEPFGYSPPPPAPVHEPEPEPQRVIEQEQEMETQPEEPEPVPASTSDQVAETPAPPSFEVGQDVFLLKDVEMRGEHGSIKLPAGRQVKILQKLDDWIVVGDEKFQATVKPGDIEK